jgi:hypothetical protein
VQVQVDDERSKLARNAACLERRATYAEGLCSNLQSQLIKSEHKVERLSKLIRDWGERLPLLQMRARCAPPYFDALACFLKRCCVESEDQRVGCAELHTAFTAFLAESCKDVEPPSQRDLRAVLEALGYEYGQVYIRSANTRGFRGLGLRPAVQASPYQPLPACDTAAAP